MAELKTKENNKSVSKFINLIEDKEKKEDSKKLIKIFKEVTKKNPKMWGDSIIGFGKYHYKSTRSSQEGDWLLTGFSPRKQNISIYIMGGFKKFQQELKELGKFKTSVSCLYVKKLEDINEKILRKIIKEDFNYMKKTHKAK